MRVKILQMVDDFGPYGGLERFIYDFSRRLKLGGDETAVAALELSERHEWGAEPIRTERLPRGVKAWIAFAERYRPDVVLWHAGPGTAASAESLAALVPVVAAVHGPVCPAGVRLFRDRDEICRHPSGSACLARWYTRRCGTRKEPWAALAAMRRAGRMLRALRVCGRVYTVSESLRGLMAIEGIGENLLHVFDNTLGSLFDPFPPLRPPGRNETLRLLFVGRVVYGKGAQYLLEAMRKLLDRNVPVDGTIVGDGWYMEKLRRLCRELGLERRVWFSGQVPGTEMNGWYDQADIVVVPSIWPEPAGLVVPEARRRGKPVVVFDSGGLPEWTALMDGVYVARHADAAHLAETIIDAAGRKEREGTESGTKRKRIDLIGDLHDFYAAFVSKEAIRT